MLAIRVGGRNTTPTTEKILMIAFLLDVDHAEHSVEQEQKFYALPQPAPPQKEEPAPGPQLYQAPGGRDA